ncbi:MAG: nicotinate phosphoribosyltransferase [Candidatus Brocadiaceae bacterium]|nr:nicotinate phosphoribosyltransferase [Candidatus Brocadiaceae bacterium]
MREPKPLFINEDNLGLVTDFYQLTMAAGYLQNDMNHPATFELFIRRLPENRPFLIAAGLEQALHYLTHLRFSREAIEYIRHHPAFKHVHKDFFSYLKKFRFSGEVFAIPEGTPVFAEEPLLRITAPIIETQLVETYLLATINFQTLIASKAVRVVLAARGREVVDFGSRRAHGPQAAVLAARACFIGGCRSTSNVLAGQQLGIPVLGTMAHSWVMAFDTEEESFRAFHRAFPEDTALLIDTYDTLRAAQLARELNIGDKLLAVRLDSGDLLSLSKGVRKILDDAGLGHVKIMASGDLNEDRIDELMRNDAPIDTFGVGTEMVTSRDQPALGGIYKLVEQERYGRHVPRMKFSEDKVFYPSSKQVYRFLNHRGIYKEDVIGVEGEDIGGQPLLEPIMHKGKLCKELPDLKDIQGRTLESLSHLPEGLKRLRIESARFASPTAGLGGYPVQKSQRLEELKRQTEEGLRRG